MPRSPTDDRAIALAPDASWAHEGRAYAYHRKNELDLAFADYDAAFTKGERTASLCYGRGLVYLKRRDFEKAIADFSAAIEIDPAHHDAYCERGGVYNERREYETAQADFTRAIELKPESWRGYWGRAAARYDSAAYADALADYDAAIARDPGTPAIFYNRAIVYERLKDAARMVVDAERYLAAAPEPSNAVEWDCRAFALFMVGKLEAGLLDVEKVLAEDSAERQRAGDARAHPGGARPPRAGDCGLSQGIDARSAPDFKNGSPGGAPAPWCRGIVSPGLRL